METFIENIKSALSSIRDNKGRSFLTMLGIIIGIGSVIMILSLGSGMTQYVNGQFDEIGGGTITVSIDTSKTIKTFSSNDCYEIKEQVEGIKGITPVGNSFDATITASKGNYDCLITYGNEDLKLSQKTEIIKGRYFNKDEAEDGSNVCIISESNAKKLFGNTNVIGLTLEMSMWGITNEVQIIGIRKDTQLDEIYAQLGIGDIIMMDVP
ncbi:MAG: ABC transporter permease, partial [Butyrivibrio sp.]|nr:ABC transporter permease [Butyrivibrio sp.]